MSAATVAGVPVLSMRVTIGNVGPWVAVCDLDSSSEVSGRVEIKIGALTLSGTVDPNAAGVFAAQRRVRIVAGAGGWGREVEAKSYHNDAQVKARTVADDAARAVGETIGGFVPTAERIGIDYVRELGPASRVLEDVIGGAPWWVDYAGVTQVGPRSTAEVNASAYQVLAYDARERIATLTTTDPSAISVGSIISESLDAPRTIRELELVLEDNELRLIAWCGGSAAGAGHLAGLMRAIIDRATDGKLFGKYRYRVSKMQGQRVDLQVVRKASGLPDLATVSLWPGIPGAHANLTLGAEVLVEFIEGDRTKPIISHFAGADGVGFVPVELVLGGTAGSPCARQNDAVEVLLPPAVFSGTIGGSPASGVLTFPLNKTLGVITAGSSKVKVAS